MVTILLWSYYLFVQMMSHIHCIVDQLNFTKKNLILNFYHFIYILMYSAYFLYPLAFTVLLVVFLLGHFKKGSCEKKSQSLHFIRLLFLRNIFFSICKLIFWYFILTLVGREGTVLDFTFYDSHLYVVE